MVATKKESHEKGSPRRRGGVFGAAPQRATDTPAAAGALEAFNKRFKVEALTRFPVHVRGALSHNLQGSQE